MALWINHDRAHDIHMKTRLSVMFRILNSFMFCFVSRHKSEIWDSFNTWKVWIIWPLNNLSRSIINSICMMWYSTFTCCCLVCCLSCCCNIRLTYKSFPINDLNLHSYWLRRSFDLIGREWNRVSWKTRLRWRRVLGSYSNSISFVAKCADCVWDPWMHLFGQWISLELPEVLVSKTSYASLSEDWRSIALFSSWLLCSSWLVLFEPRDRKLVVWSNSSSSPESREYRDDDRFPVLRIE